MKHLTHWFLSIQLSFVLLPHTFIHSEEFPTEIPSTETDYPAYEEPSTEIPSTESPRTEIPRDMPTPKTPDSETTLSPDLPVKPEEKVKYSVDLIKTLNRLNSIRKTGKISFKDILFSAAISFSAEQIQLFDGLELKEIKVDQAVGFTRGIMMTGKVQIKGGTEKGGVDVEAKLMIVDPTSEDYNQAAAREKAKIEDALERDLRDERGKKGQIARDKVLVAENEYVGMKELFDEEQKPAKPRTQEPDLPKVGVSFMIGLPKQTKFSLMTGNKYPKLNPILDKLTLPAGKLILSNFFYAQTTDDLFEILKSGEKKPEFKKQYNRLEVIPIKKGLNFVAELGLAGPFQLFDQFIKSAAKSKLNALIFKAGDATLHGIITPDMIGSQFGASIPISLGVDFTKIPTLPRTFKVLLKQLSTEGFYVVLAPVKTEFTVGSAYRVLMGCQDPLVLNLEGDIKPTELGMSVFTDSTLTFDWGVLTECVRKETGAQVGTIGEGGFSIGNVGLQLNWNYELLPAALAMGIPFTGFGIRGSIRIGPEVHGQSHPIICQITDESVNTFEGDTILCLTAAAKMQADQKFGELVFEGIAKELNITKMVQFFAQLAKKDVQLKMPNINFKQLRIYVAPVDAVVAGKEFKAGIAFDTQWQWDKLEGIINGRFVPENNKIKSAAFKGKMTPIDTAYFKLLGIPAKPEETIEYDEVKKPEICVIKTADAFAVGMCACKPNDTACKEKDEMRKKIENGPLVDLSYNEYEFKFLLKAQMEIPPMALLTKIDLSFIDNVLKGKTTSMVGNLFSSTFECDFDPSNLENLKIAFNFRQDFVNVIIGAMQDIQNNSQSDLEKIAQAARLVQGKVEQFRQQFSQGYPAQLNAINQKIAAIDRDLNDLRERCKKLDLISCGKVVGAEADRASYIAIRDGLVIPSKQAVTNITNQINIYTAQLSQIQSQQAAYQAYLNKLTEIVSSAVKTAMAIEIRKAAGYILGSELKAGKLPMLKVLEVKINIPKYERTITLQDLQFDFKNPKESAKNIANQLIIAVTGAAPKVYVAP